MSNYQVTWRCPRARSGGWGTASREYILALNRLGVDMQIYGQYTSHSHKVLVYHYHPHNIDLKKERTNFDCIILNTAWETTKIPNHWHPTINHFDAIFVPSKQNIFALQNSEVTIPIFLVPHGVDTEFFNPKNGKMPLDGSQKRFVFLSVFDFQHRKNPEGLLRAFWEEFKYNEPVMLILKTHWSGNRKMNCLIGEIIADYKNSLGISHKETAPLHLITETLPKDELKGLYTLADAFVLPTRGEAVGLPFMEALSSGIPVIATAWGGQMDFLNEGNAFLVDYRLRCPVDSMKNAISRQFRHLFADRGQLWAEPDIISLRKQMRFAYENQALCKEKGKQGRKDMIKMSWDEAGMALKKALDEVVKK